MEVSFVLLPLANKKIKYQAKMHFLCQCYNEGAMSVNRMPNWHENKESQRFQLL